MYQQIQKAVLYTQDIYSADVLFQWDFSVVNQAAVRCQQDTEHSLCWQWFETWILNVLSVEYSVSELCLELAYYTKFYVKPHFYSCSSKHMKCCVL